MDALLYILNFGEVSYQYLKVCIFKGLWHRSYIQK